MPGLNRRLGRNLMASAGGAAWLASTTTGLAHSNDPRWDMINTLGVYGPRIETGEDPQARIFDNFVGTWDTDDTFIQEDGSRQKSTGQLIAGWVLDGRVIQDLWIGIPPGESQRWMGTTLRFYDSERKTWRVTWVSPLARAALLLEGGGDAKSIVLFGEDKTSTLRWSFSNITDKDFVWRGEFPRDDGATWRLREEHQMRRSRSGPRLA